MSRIIIIILVAFPCWLYAGDLPANFMDLNEAPKITITHNSSGWPIYKVESVKYHLWRFIPPIKQDSPTTQFLIKEKLISEMTDGIEGTKSEMVLELWELGIKSVGCRIWRITQKADEWKMISENELVLIKYGCCDSPNIHNYYGVRTGKFIRVKKVENR